jgi:hypothetical protein
VSDDESAPERREAGGYLPPIVVSMIADGSMRRLSESLASIAAAVPEVSEPSVPPMIESPHVISARHIASRFDAALAPIADNVSNIARPRGLSLAVTILVVVASFAAITGAVFEVLSYFR